jgi:flagellar biosynthetic protein FliR
LVNFQVSTTEVGILLAILLRVSIILFLVPIFAGRQVPGAVKALATLALSGMMFGLAHRSVTPLPFEPASLLWIVMGELILGAFLALAVQMIFSGFQLAGELISFQMGFGFAQSVDPQNGVSMMILSRWLQIIATLIFFSLNGHHVIISAIVESFRHIPMGGFTAGAAMMHHLNTLFRELLIIAIKLSAPITVAMLLGQLALGLASKYAPQVNILASVFPLTILLGFLFLGISATLWGEVVATSLGSIMSFVSHWLSFPRAAPL